MEHIYKTITGYVYAFQRMHFELLQMLVQLDGRAQRYREEAPSPAEFLAQVGEAQSAIGQLVLSAREHAVFEMALEGLHAAAQQNERLIRADFRLPEREIALAAESCRKTQQLLRQCRLCLR